MTLHWVTAVSFARMQSDVTFEEWCDLYYDPANPTKEQIDKSCETARPILVRNGLIEEGVTFEGQDDSPTIWPRRDDPGPYVQYQRGRT